MKGKYIPGFSEEQLVSFSEMVHGVDTLFDLITSLTLLRANAVYKEKVTIMI